MRKLLFYAVSLFGLVQLAQAQATRIHPDPSQGQTNAAKSESYSVLCAGEGNPQTVDLKWRPILYTKFQSFEPQSPDEELIEAVKEEKLAVKRASYVGIGIESTSTVTPEVGTNFLGNVNNGSSPLDNGIAVSNGGIIVSVANATLEIDNAAGTNLYYNDLASFINDVSISNVCDPIVSYDKQADRFVMFVQECSGNSSNSYIFLFFSKTNNPATGGWWKYKITGDPRSDASWFDYPKMAISDNEICVTGNLFSNTGTFRQAVAYQVTKSSCYAGGALNYSLWYNFSGAPFTLLPVTDGQGLSFTPGFFLVSTDNSGASTVNLYDLTDDRTGSPVINYYSVATTAYSPAADSDQLGTSCQLDNGDCRALSGFYQNGYIHFVFHSDIGNGWNGINYNRMNLNSSIVNQSILYGSSGNFDYSYPSVASFSNTVSDLSVMIGFGRVSSAVYPQVRVVNCDNGLNFSGSTLVKASDSYVSYTSTTKERWGDYTGISRRHNSATPSVWMNGMYGTNSNKWNTWIAEIHGQGSVAIEPLGSTIGVKAYPNPIQNHFALEFVLDEETDLEIKLIDNLGKVVQHLYSGKGRSGHNVFTFNQEGLESGTYYLQILNRSTLLKNEKIIVVH
jgi:hypothetical protein